MKKINEKKKGFTLIELLVTIAILAVVGSIMIAVVMNFIEKSQYEADALTEKSIKEAANIYSNEVDSGSWKSSTDDSEYFCVTVQELVNKGILKNDQIKNSKYSLNRYVAVLRNKTTKTIEKEEIIDKNADENLQEKCTGAPKVPEGYIPEISISKSYTDELYIEVYYKEANKVITNSENNDKITNVVVEYGETSSNLEDFNDVDDEINKNIEKKEYGISGLEKNTEYYIRACIETQKKKKACTDTVSGKTLEFVKPSITLGDNITINYDTTNTNGEVNRYFYSEVKGISKEDVFECNEKFECETSSTTRDIREKVWYKTTSNEIMIDATDGSGEIQARIADKKGNFDESNMQISVNKINFVKGDASYIDGKTTDIEKKCLAEKGKSCKITSPIITANKGYEGIGWNNDSNAIVSNWDVGVEKEVIEYTTYYPVFVQSPIYIYYYANGGKITGSAGGYKWTTDSSGLIKKDNDAKFYKIASNTSSNELGLVNYNNSNYVNVTRDGYIAISGSEWNTKSDGSGISFNQDTIYSYNDLISYATLSENDYILNLYVNWKDIAPPTCTISVSGNIKLTVTGRDNEGLATAPYSWTNSSAGFSGINSKNVSSIGTYTAYVMDASGNINSCSVEISYTDVSYIKYEKTCIGKVTCRSSIGNNNSCSSQYTYNSSTKLCARCTSGTYDSIKDKCDLGNATRHYCAQLNKTQCNKDTHGCKWASAGRGSCYGLDIEWYTCSSGYLSGTKCYSSPITSQPSCAAGSKSGSYCYEYNQDYCSNKSPYYWTQSSDTSYFGTETSSYASYCSPNSFTCINSKEGQVQVRCEPNYSCSPGYSYLNSSYCYKQK